MTRAADRSPDPLDPMPTVLAFDVFGTVVDWHGSIEREVAALGLGIDAGAFALAWRAGYRPAMAQVRSGALGWTKIDVLHRMILDEILDRFGVANRVDEAARRSLNLAWHRLDPWPDVVEGLNRLRNRFMLCTLSNGNLGLLADLSRRARLHWDLVLSAEVFRHYKPDPQTYLGVCEVFDVEPARMMLVAAHHDDLEAARACGCRTAYVERPLEYGPTVANDVAPRPGNDLHARDLGDLARQLGC
ncbi:MAG: haloacid dehalogenase type II [Burkholderiaceae bacterium]|nr:haloacid dehalogenase type II [Burkholderiaceae bacterium]